jgi:hypothetical protein
MGTLRCATSSLQESTTPLLQESTPFLLLRGALRCAAFRPLLHLLLKGLWVKALLHAART